MMADINETRLSNGLVVLTDRMAGVRSATLGFFYRVGSRHESLDLAGISHFIEHTVFKGSANRTALQIAIEQDRLGGNFDAFTTHEETGFVIKVIDDQLELAFDLIAEMLTAPRFDDADLASEQKVIIEEMKMIEDSPEEMLGEIFSEAFFPAHPLGRNIAGTPKSVRSFDSKRTREYHHAAFGPPNLVIAAAGNVGHDDVVSLAERYFPAPHAANGRVDPAAITAPLPDAPIIVKHKADLEQAHLVIAAPFVSATDERRYAADLMSGIIGGGTSSRLWQKVREERGLAYSVGASAISYLDCGMFSMFAATSPDQVEEVIDLAMHELRAVKVNGVTEDELELAKQQTRASVLMSLEDSAARAGALAQSEMVHGRQISVEETLDRIDAVSRDDIQELAREHFRSEEMAAAVLGDVDGLEITRDTLAIA